MNSIAAVCFFGFVFTEGSTSFILLILAIFFFVLGCRKELKDDEEKKRKYEEKQELEHVQMLKEYHKEKEREKRKAANERKNMKREIDENYREFKFLYQKD